jgi:uncharacterized protein with gpF-like domain
MAKKTIEEIMEDKNPTFVNMVKDMRTKKELEDAMVIYLRQKEDLSIKKERDEGLNALKLKKTELSKPYNQTISALKKMINCIYKFGHSFQDDLRLEFEKNLILYNKQLSYIKGQKDEDSGLNAVTEAIKDINDDYNPSINELGLKADYLAYILKVKFDMGEIEEVEV